MELTIPVRRPEVAQALQEEARRRGMSVEALIVTLLTTWVDNGMMFAEPFHRVQQE
jgi:hypothetical protein